MNKKSSDNSMYTTRIADLLKCGTEDRDSLVDVKGTMGREMGAIGIALRPAPADLQRPRLRADTFLAPLGTCQGVKRVVTHYRSPANSRVRLSRTFSRD